MKIRLLLVLLLLIPKLFYSQDFSDSWTGHFSYLDIKDVSQGSSKVFGAAENAIFIYDINTNGIEKLSTIHGLSGEAISSIHYVEANGLLLIGFDNGLMQVYIESDKEFITVVDIFNKPTIPPNEKKINHFNIYNGFAYVSTDFGISLYDIENLEFGDTYFIGAGGSQVKVRQTTVFEGYIYAASNIRLHRALVDDSNLIDFDVWEDLTAGDWFGVQKVEDRLYAASANKRVYEVINTSITEQIAYPDHVNSFNNVEDKLVVTTKNLAVVYAENFTQITSAVINADYDAKISTATISTEEQLYIGTQGDFNLGKPGFGILKTTYNDPAVFEEIYPDCPLANNSFAVKAVNNNAWVTYGDYSVSYNPNPAKKRGFSHLRNEEWTNIPFDSLLGARNLNVINVNPLNLGQVFINSFKDGLLEVNNDSPTILYTAGNSSFQSVSTNPNNLDVRNSASKIDRNGILWCTNALMESPLKSYNIGTGEWKSYNFSSIIPDPINTELGYGSMDIDENGVKWVGGHRLGIIGYNEDSNLLKHISGEENNMPSSSVKTVAVDRNNTVWMGTDKGLRVIYNTSDFFDNPNFQASEIIILDDGIARELLFQQYITDIEVDGSNNKWIATLDTGLYYFSADGQNNIFHFTKDNSPLPTNDIMDVSIDESNGEVYIATTKGLLSYKSDTSKPQKTLEDVYAYPNPVRPTFNITQDKIKIKGLTDNVNIKITDIEGNLVTEAESRTNSRFKGYNLEIDGGTALWNGKNLSGRVVASGVYLILISDLDSLETKVLKIMIVR